MHPGRGVNPFYKEFLMLERNTYARVYHFAGDSV